MLCRIIPMKYLISSFLIECSTFLILFSYWSGTITMIVSLKSPSSFRKKKARKVMATNATMSFRNIVTIFPAKSVIEAGLRIFVIVVTAMSYSVLSAGISLYTFLIAVSILSSWSRSPWTIDPASNPERASIWLLTRGMNITKKRARRPYSIRRVSSELRAFGNLNFHMRMPFRMSTTGLPISEITPAAST